MSDQTRRSFVRNSAITAVSLGALASGVGSASDRERLTADQAERMQLDAATVESVGGDATTQATWPVSFSFDSAPGEGKAGDAPDIVGGVFYDFDLSYSPELSIDIGFLDTGTDTLYGYTVNGSGTYRLEAPEGIPEDSAAVGILNPSDNSRAVSGDLSVDE
ncbi:twin-arginine translocation signal domain-containing protein [Halorussus amylolyticus]|uniref:twin-arginine translocation signal domain-containing protein n=1 Tax=Halorussus amylolyticus TaxID=1126242 RepID=UPI001051B378|nr:twin-arginine translocation signal domain-containing protein [Halorussus amylolyticus]